MFFFAFFGLTIWTTLSYTVNTGELVAPNLKGENLSEIEEILESKELNFTVQNKRYSDSVRKGRVISQEPASGVRVSQGQTLKLILSKGLKQVTVPDLIELNFREAQIKIRQKGLKEGNVYKVYSGEFEENDIMGQEPPSGVKKDPGEEISLVVSRGEKPNYFVMPDLVGETVSDGSKYLNSMGISRLNKIEKDSPYQKGTIIEQMPKPGNKARKGMVVKLIYAG